MSKRGETRTLLLSSPLSNLLRNSVFSCCSLFRSKVVRLIKSSRVIPEVSSNASSSPPAKDFLRRLRAGAGASTGEPPPPSGSISATMADSSSKACAFSALLLRSRSRLRSAFLDSSFPRLPSSSAITAICHSRDSVFFVYWLRL